ncbi:MAG: methyltransferase domain-containing protein [Anaerolinea sp.]|nr:methyltransferase domain-containing protein [Anaerolinea sp.]
MPPSELAALRGEPSYVWRAGQERRLQMIVHWGRVTAQTRVLEHGAGVGMYASQLRRRYTPYVECFDIEWERTREASVDTPHAVVAAAEALPYAANTFDVLISNEVLEHVRDDEAAAREIVRVLKPGGRAIIFVPNRWYPFETHGHYWRGRYHFGNTPLINYLPDQLRDRLAPHVRAYTWHSLRRLFSEKAVQIIEHRRIYGGYDNIIARLGTPGRIVRDLLYRLEGTLLDSYGLSHLLVIEKR